MRNIRRAFTLIEMLTVIAISAVLLTIIVLPVFQSFNLTRAGEAFADAQAQARTLSERIAREVSSAVSVRNLSGSTSSTLNDVTENLPNHSLVITLPSQNVQNAPTVEVDIPYAKMDLVEDLQVGGGSATTGYTNPANGFIDPTLKAPVGQPGVPVIPSQTLVRYWIGLRNPFAPYNDPYSGIMMPQNGNQDNLYVLYRAVFPATISNGTTIQGNNYLFALNSGNGAIMDDPRFFTADYNTNGTVAQDAHNALIYHWMGQSAPWETGVGSSTQTNYAHTVVQTQVSRYDMIMPVYSQANFKAQYDLVNTTGAPMFAPKVVPLAQFRPGVVSNDPASGQEAVRQGQEADYATLLGPDTFQTKYGLWSNAIVRTYPAGFTPNSANDLYEVGFSALTGGAPGFSLYGFNPASGTDDFENDTEVFDLYTYENAAAMLGSGTTAAVYPFTQAALAANGRSGWLSSAQMRAIFTPFDTLTGPGKLRASFDISEVGVNALTVNANNPFEYAGRPNVPTLYLPDTPVQPDAYTEKGMTTFPDYSPLTTSGTFDVNYDVNAAFDRAWYENPNLQPMLQRFIDLRVLPNEDGTYGPLYPGRKEKKSHKMKKK